MGAGKTTIGRLLSATLNGAFIDHDDYIVNKARMSIPDMFSKNGEAYFRQFEHDCLDDLLIKQIRPKELDNFEGPLVIAGGGGIAQREDNRALIKELSLCIYLHLDVDHQYQRVKNDTNRPMIHVSDIKTRLGELFEVRDPQYREIAFGIVDTNNDQSSIIRSILEILESYQASTY